MESSTPNGTSTAHTVEQKKNLQKYISIIQYNWFQMKPFAWHCINYILRRAAQCGGLLSTQRVNKKIPHNMENLLLTTLSTSITFHISFRYIVSTHARTYAHNCSRAANTGTEKMEQKKTNTTCHHRRRGRHRRRRRRRSIKYEFYFESPSSCKNQPSPFRPLCQRGANSRARLPQNHIHCGALAHATHVCPVAGTWCERGVNKYHHEPFHRRA